MNLGRALLRYRPYVVAVVATLAIVAVPALRDDDGPATGDQVAAGSNGTGDVAGSVAEAVAADALAGAGAGGAVTAVGGRAGNTARAGTGSASAGGSAAAGVAQSAGIGSKEALSAPDCDAATGRLKLAFLYAPPCVVPFPKGADNGGATTAGVTPTTIKIVALQNSQDTATNADAQKASFSDYAEMFQNLYRTWGRKLEVVWYTLGASDEAAQRADAIQIASMKPFAAVSAGVSVNGDVLVEELASRKIMVCCYTAITLKRAKTLAPFLWGGTLGSPEGYALNFAQYAGKKLLGQPAKWAGQPDYQALPRKFGLIYPDTWDIDVFTKEFASYGGKLAEAASYGYAASDYPSYQERSRVVVSKLKAAGVTTVLDAGSILFDPVTTKEATAQQWFPEWAIAGTGGQDVDFFARLFDQTQWQHAFGLSSFGVGGDPPAPANQLYDWYWGSGRGTRSPAYLSTNILFWGIHGAGPILTPETFRDGVFALPPSGGAASGGFMGAQISFGRHGFFPWDDYNPHDDFAEVYWDATARGKDSLTCEAGGGTCTEGVGKYRYLNGGRRYTPFHWPSGEAKFFDPAGTALWYTQYPPGDRPPSYPCVGCPSQGGS